MTTEENRFCRNLLFAQRSRQAWYEAGGVVLAPPDYQKMKQKKRQHEVFAVTWIES